MSEIYVLRLVVFVSFITTSYKSFSAAAAADSCVSLDDISIDATALDAAGFLDPELRALSGLFAEALKPERGSVDALALSKIDNFQGFSFQEIQQILQHTKNNQLDMYCALKTIPELLKIIQLANYIDCKELFNKTAQKIAQRFVKLGKIINPQDRTDPLSIHFYKDNLPDDIQRTISSEIIALHPSDFFSAPNFMKRRVEEDYAGVIDHVKTMVFNGHTNRVSSVSWSPDGTKLATSSFDKTVRIWDVVTAKCIKVFGGHTGKVYSVSWNPQGTKLATASQDSTVWIWNLETGNCDRVLLGHINNVYSVAWKPDGTKLATASRDSTVCIWDAVTGNCEQTFLGHTDEVYLVSWNPAGTKLATASCDNTVRVWDGFTGRCDRVLNNFVHCIYSVSWNPTGDKLALASFDKTVHIWDVNTGDCGTILIGHTNAVLSVSWDPLGEKLSTASCDKTISIWDAATEVLEKTFHGHTDWVMSVSWNHDATLLASASRDNTACIWDIGTVDKEIKKMNSLTFKELISLDLTEEIAYQKAQKTESAKKSKLKSQKAADDCCRLS